MGNAGNKISNFGSHVFDEVKNGADTLAHGIETVAEHGEGIVKDVLATGQNIVTHTEDSVTGIAKGAELTIAIPLALLGLGLAIMLGRSNSSTIETVGGAAISKI